MDDSREQLNQPGPAPDSTMSGGVGQPPNDMMSTIQPMGDSTLNPMGGAGQAPLATDRAGGYQAPVQFDQGQFDYSKVNVAD